MTQKFSKPFLELTESQKDTYWKIRDGVQIYYLSSNEDIKELLSQGYVKHGLHGEYQAVNFSGKVINR